MSSAPTASDPRPHRRSWDPGSMVLRDGQSRAARPRPEATPRCSGRSSALHTRGWCTPCPLKFPFGCGRRDGQKHLPNRSHRQPTRHSKKPKDPNGQQRGVPLRDFNNQPMQLELPREGRASVALPGVYLLTLTEAAQLLRVHPETVRRHAAALGGIRVGRIWRFAHERLQSGRACAPGIGENLWVSGSEVTSGGLTSPHQAASELDKVLRQLTNGPRKNSTIGFAASRGGQESSARSPGGGSRKPQHAGSTRHAARLPSTTTPPKCASSGSTSPESASTRSPGTQSIV